MNKLAELNKLATLYVACRGLLRVKTAVAAGESTRPYDIGGEGSFWGGLWNDAKQAFNDTIAANVYDPEREAMARRYNKQQLQRAMDNLAKGDTTTGFNAANSYIDGRQVESLDADMSALNDEGEESASGSTPQQAQASQVPNITIQLPEGYGGGGGGYQQQQQPQQQYQPQYQQPYYQQQPSLQDRINSYNKYQQQTA